MEPKDSTSSDFATIQDVSIDAVTSRVSPRQVTTGVTRGTQTYMNVDGSYMTLGLIPNTTGFGITKLPIMLSKLLPDGTYGTVIAKVGVDVTTLFS